MNNRNLPLWGMNVTYRYIWYPCMLAMLMGILLIGLWGDVPDADKAMIGVGLGIAFMWMALIGVFASVVCREQAKRIKRLEEQVAALSGKQVQP